MKKFVSIIMAVLMLAVLFAGCKNISDSNDGSIEPSVSRAPSQGGHENDNDTDGDDSIGMPTVMPELVPSDGVDQPSALPNNTPDASDAQQGSQPPAGGNSSAGGNDTAGNDTAGQGGSAHT